MAKSAEELHPDYSIGFEEGRILGYEQACDDLTNGSVAHSIIHALRKAGRKMHVPQDHDVIYAALKKLKASMLK